jgi:hypothetical protein
LNLRPLGPEPSALIQAELLPGQEQKEYSRFAANLQATINFTVLFFKVTLLSFFAARFHIICQFPKHEIAMVLLGFMMRECPINMKVLTF